MLTVTDAKIATSAGLDCLVRPRPPLVCCPAVTLRLGATGCCLTPATAWRHSRGGVGPAAFVAWQPRRRAYRGRAQGPIPGLPHCAAVQLCPLGPGVAGVSPPLTCGAPMRAGADVDMRAGGAAAGARHHPGLRAACAPSRSLPASTPGMQAPGLVRHRARAAWLHLAAGHVPAAPLRLCLAGPERWQSALHLDARWVCRERRVPKPGVRAVLPIYVHGSRVNSSVDTNSSTLQKLTLSNIDKGSTVFWCAPGVPAVHACALCYLETGRWWGLWGEGSTDVQEQELAGRGSAPHPFRSTVSTIGCAAAWQGAHSPIRGAPRLAQSHSHGTQHCRIQDTRGAGAVELLEGDWQGDCAFPSPRAYLQSSPHRHRGCQTSQQPSAGDADGLTCAVLRAGSPVRSAFKQTLHSQVQDPDS